MCLSSSFWGQRANWGMLGRIQKQRRESRNTWSLLKFRLNVTSAHVPLTKAYHMAKSKLCLQWRHVQIGVKKTNHSIYHIISMLSSFLLLWAILNLFEHTLLFTCPIPSCHKFLKSNCYGKVHMHFESWGILSNIIPKRLYTPNNSAIKCLFPHFCRY